MTRRDAKGPPAVSTARDAEDPGLPYLIDTEALPLGHFVVLNRSYREVREFHTLDEALRFVAAANGTDVDTVQQDTGRRAHALAGYVRNLRRGGKGTAGGPGA